MLDLTKIAEQESAAETLLASKGFSETVVTVSDGKVDVVVGNVEMTDANRAQIEDIVTRKTGVSPENIIISPIHKDATKDSTDDSKEESQESTKEE